MIKAYNVMTKGVVSIPASTPIKEAAKIMLDRGINSLVIERGGKSVGIITSRNFVMHVAGEETKKNVGEIMTSPLVKVPFDAELPEVLRTMSDNGIKHVLVEEGGKLTGVITLRDIVASAPESILSYVMEKLTDFNIPNL
jgi:signal-transduction protein with cAMP-binding, CBS, and nucleotidyltransferase domain